MFIAHIVIFVYNRLWHTRQTIEALQKNEFASESELFIYSDAPKNDGAIELVSEVRDYIKTITGFKTITIIKRESNWGLAANIIDGVSEIITRYGKVIVLEDDHITSPNFLSFMNNALNFYQNEKSVWHISGWNYPISQEDLQDTFLWPTMNCWGWATWADRWKYYEKNTDKLIKGFTPEMIKNFNLENLEDFWSQVLDNASGKKNTWAIYWYATIFRYNGLCLNPTISFVQNIGHDGTGENCIDSSYCENIILNVKKDISYSKTIEVSEIAVRKIKAFYRSQKKSLLVRAINKFYRILSGKNLIQ